jgi:uroporphyrinogen III methyltransferase/synthase
MGAQVDEAAAYTTLAVDDRSAELIGLLEKRQIDMVTFTSSSTVKNFIGLLPKTRFQALMKDVAVASIGPITTETAQKLGVEVTITAQEYTIGGLCRAIYDYFHPPPV